MTAYGWRSWLLKACPLNPRMFPSYRWTSQLPGIQFRWRGIGCQGGTRLFSCSCIFSLPSQQVLIARVSYCFHALTKKRIQTQLVYGCRVILKDCMFPFCTCVTIKGSKLKEWLHKVLSFVSTDFTR